MQVKIKALLQEKMLGIQPQKYLRIIAFTIFLLGVSTAEAQEIGESEVQIKVKGQKGRLTCNMVKKLEFLHPWMEKPDCKDTSVFRTTLHWDNDMVGEPVYRDLNQDGQYSQGIHYESVFLAKQRNAPNENIEVGWNFSQRLYTPDLITITSVTPEQKFDRPYAAVLYLGWFSKKNNPHKNSYTKAGLNFAIIGKGSGAEVTQGGVHVVSGTSQLPRGWGTQIQQELGVIYTLEYLPTVYRSPLGYFDFASVLKGQFGNIHTDGAIDLIVRAGRLEPYLSGKQKIHAHFFFARLQLKAVAYNATLQGGFFRNRVFSDKFEPEFHQFKYSEIYPLVGEIELGVRTGFSVNENQYQLGYSIIQISDEFRVPGKKWNARYHEYGQIFANVWY